MQSSGKHITHEVYFANNNLVFFLNISIDLNTFAALSVTNRNKTYLLITRKYFTELFQKRSRLIMQYFRRILYYLNNYHFSSRNRMFPGQYLQTI